MLAAAARGRLGHDECRRSRAFGHSEECERSEDGEQSAAFHAFSPIVESANSGPNLSLCLQPLSRNGTSHCPFMREVRYATAMNRGTISAFYYYPDEVGIG
jgi:hypothetical protein